MINLHNTKLMDSYVLFIYNLFMYLGWGEDLPATIQLFKCQTSHEEMCPIRNSSTTQRKRFQGI